MEELKKTLKSSNTEVCVLSLQCLNRLCQLSAGLLSMATINQLIRSILQNPNPLEMRKACYELLTTVTAEMFTSSPVNGMRFFTSVVKELIKNLKPDDVAIQYIKKGNTEVVCHLQWLVQQKDRLKGLNQPVKENLVEVCIDLFTGNSSCFPLITEVIQGTQLKKATLIVILNQQKQEVVFRALDSLKSLVSSLDLTTSPSFASSPLNANSTPLPSPYKSPYKTPNSSRFIFTFDDIPYERSYTSDLSPHKFIGPNSYGRIHPVDEKSRAKEVEERSNIICS